MGNYRKCRNFLGEIKTNHVKLDQCSLVDISRVVKYHFIDFIVSLGIPQTGRHF